MNIQHMPLLARAWINTDRWLASMLSRKIDFKQRVKINEKNWSCTVCTIERQHSTFYWPPEVRLLSTGFWTLENLGLLLVIINLSRIVATIWVYETIAPTNLLYKIFLKFCKVSTKSPKKYFMVNYYKSCKWQSFEA